LYKIIGTINNKTEMALPRSGWARIIATGIIISIGKLVFTKNSINQGLTNSVGWKENIPKSNHLLDPRVMLFRRIGNKSAKHELTNMKFFDEDICFGLIWVPIIKRIIPITQEENCLSSNPGASELTINMFIKNKTPRQIIRESWLFFDM
jgi:hypothetical protein